MLEFHFDLAFGPFTIGVFSGCYNEIGVLPNMPQYLLKDDVLVIFFLLPRGAEVSREVMIVTSVLQVYIPNSHTLRIIMSVGDVMNRNN